MISRFRRRVKASAAKPLIFAAALSVALPAGAQSVPGLPVRKVQLFTSGVAYVERAGQINGNAQIPLTFRTAQVNDILKSMVLIDTGGRVQPATFGTRDPISRSLKAFAIDVSENVTLESLLGRLRGTQVEILQGGKSLARGAVAGVEKKTEPRAGGTVELCTINLLTAEGLSPIVLEAGRTLRVLDPALDAEFRSALAILASGSDDGKRQVQLHFAGTGTRLVRVGYVTESPVWKISYRLLVSGESPGGKPFLQGWALVENSTDEDWTNVDLSLVSGRPVSFIQDLYQPLYIPRPQVGPDIAASPLPQTHDSSIETDPAVAVQAPVGFVAKGGRAAGGQAGEAKDGPAGMPGRVAKSKAPVDGYYDGHGNNINGLELNRDLAANFMAKIGAAAAGRHTGELFSYTLKTPLNLPRQQAAMIPIISGAIDADRISLYNFEIDPKFAMNGLRVHNNSGLHLKGGPITLFDGAAYAGDSRMEDVAPGDTRIITYAVDQGVICNHEVPRDDAKVVSIRAKAGVLTQQSKNVTETLYTFRSTLDKPRTMVIEHPRDAEETLAEPAKPGEKTDTLYRFQIQVPAKKTVAFKVTTVKVNSETVSIVDANSDTLYQYYEEKTISPRVKQALQALIVRRRKVAELKAAAANRKAEIAGISTDQERIRRNMGALDHNSPLYKRYTGELDAQETKIASLRADYARLSNQAATADRDARKFADTISD